MLQVQLQHYYGKYTLHDMRKVLNGSKYINVYINYTVGTASASGVLFVTVFITMVLQETPEGVVVGWC